ncbi:MAG: glutamyl-tRNA reductase [Cyclobacteriaceae bacterium]|nr:glutamyl-tRNA reductase [Cyclobacteriaceae bacterium SS2]
MEHFKSIGISFKNTPLEVREAISLNEESTRSLLTRLGEVLGLDELLILSTCNRTEVYYASKEDLNDQILALLGAFKGLDIDSIRHYFVAYQDEHAINHLFEVALGLDSRVLGDIQISNQVKKAYQWSADEGLAGPFIHRLMHTIFFSNKRVVQETEFRDGTASIASVAVDLTRHFTKNFTLPKIALIGLGEIGEDVAGNLKDFEGEITLVNRTDEKAAELAEELGFLSRPYSELSAVVASSDVVISAVNSPEPIITTQNFGSTSNHKMIIDLSVPRSVSPEVEGLNGILLYNIDQLDERTKEALSKRQGAVGHVRSIINESLSEFKEWSQEMEVSPTIQKLKNALEEIRRQELARYVGKVDEKQSKLLDKATKNMIQKVIKLPVLQLKAACKRGEAETLVGVLNDLFNLEKDHQETK